MTIKDAFSKIFKCPSKNKNQDILTLFREINKDLYNVPVHKFTKKYTKIFERERKSISSLSKEDRKKRFDDGIQEFNTFKGLKGLSKLRFIGDLGIKYDFVHSHIETYLDDLKKSL